MRYTIETPEGYHLVFTEFDSWRDVLDALAELEYPPSQITIRSYSEEDPA